MTFEELHRQLSDWSRANPAPPGMEWSLRGFDQATGFIYEPFLVNRPGFPLSFIRMTEEELTRQLHVELRRLGLTEEEVQQYTVEFNQEPLV